MKRISLLSLFVNDLNAAIAFYLDKLGFVVAEDLPMGETRWITLRFPDDDEVKGPYNE